jgi:hypothetical protein
MVGAAEEAKVGENTYGSKWKLHHQQVDQEHDTVRSRFGNDIVSINERRTYTRRDCEAFLIEKACALHMHYSGRRFRTNRKTIM